MTTDSSGVPASPSGSTLQPAVSAAIPNADWRCAPLVPTEEMKCAGFESEAWDRLGMAVVKRKGWPYSCRESAECVAGIYRAMLEAAPARGIEADARRAGAESPVPSGTRPEGMAAAAQGEALTELLKMLDGKSGAAYCRYIEILRRDEGLGWEHKTKHGKFGEAELKAHTLAAEHLGMHRAFAAALSDVRAALAQGEAPPPSLPAMRYPSEEAIDEYLEGYEFRGDDGDYTPNERERFLMKDAIMGLFADESLFASPTPEQAQPAISTEHGPWLASMHDEGETYCQRCKVRSVFASQRKCDPHIAAEQAQPAVPALTDERAELVAAWNDLPDSLRCHPGLKRLFRACQAMPSATPPAQVEQPTSVLGASPSGPGSTLQPPAAASASIPGAFEVRVAGPDDVAPFDDELTALRYANAINVEYAADCLRNPDPMDHVLCVATVHTRKDSHG